MLLPTTENGVDVGQGLQPFVPPIEVPIYPEAHTVHAAAPLPIVAVLFVLYPIPQAVHPDEGTAPSLEKVPCGHLPHTEASLPTVPEPAVDLPEGQIEHPTNDDAVVALL